MKVGDIIENKYDLVRLIREGRRGSVFEARHRELGHRVAIKVLDRSFADRAEELGKLLEVARAVAAIGSEHIVRITDQSVTDEGVPFLVMELVDGPDLGTLVRNEGPLEPRRAAALACQLCDALSPAHELGIMHLDLEPASLVLERGDGGDERLKVLDFGAAHLGEPASASAPGAAQELPYYQAPEQLRLASDVDQRADVYSAGAILYELLTGARPFQAVSRADLSFKVSVSSPPSARFLRPEIHPALEQAVQRAMARAPSDRFETARDLAEALRPHALGQVIDVPAPVAPAPPPTAVMSRSALPVSSFGAPPQPSAFGPAAAPRFPVAPLPPPPLPSGSEGASAVRWIIGISVSVVVIVVALVVVGFVVALAQVRDGETEVSSRDASVVVSAPLPAPPTDTKVAGAQVDVTVHVMSQCPFGVKVVDTMTSLARKMGPGMQLNLEYIGTDQNGVLTSMHGEGEVQGDRLQLCAHRHGSYQAWLDFLDCQNESWRTIPTGWEVCALRAGADAELIRTCFTGPEGEQLLRASFARSSEQDVRGSPTIFIAGVKHSGSRSEEVFARAICGHFPSGLEPPYCQGIQEAGEVPVRILVDQRCTTRECSSVTRFEALIQSEVPGARITKIDYESGEGMALWHHLKIIVADTPPPASGRRPFGLPVALFGKAIEHVDYYQRLERRMVRVGDEHLFQLGSWDPESEICDNLVDDDGDQRADCQDSDCEVAKACRPELPRHLSVFVMSQCPYGIKVLNAMDTVLEQFGRDRSKLDFRIEFIGRLQDDGSLSSMHGQAEVEEDLREICVQQHYGEGYAFMDYILCRNRDIRSSEWRPCARPPLDPAVIQECAEGPEGRRLLTESFALARSLDINGSPTWLLNNRYEMSGRDPETITRDYCARNDVPECSSR